MNTAFEYQYRDASNYKKSKKVVFAGAITDVERALLHDHLEDGQHFLAGPVGLEDLQLRWENLGEDDHPWSELVEISPVEWETTEVIDIHDFVAMFCATEWDGVTHAVELGLDD